MMDLFPAQDCVIDDGALLLAGHALENTALLWREICAITEQSPFRHMLTPGGKTMSVAMSNCGDAGWVSDRRGYRYDALDPLTGRNWPAMPDIFATLAADAAKRSGFVRVTPDVCLINRYEIGARMALHQDRDEGNFNAPIVSVSLGLPAVFLWGGRQRSDRPRKYPLNHGDVVVWGGPSRLNFHGIMPIKPGSHPALGPFRYNLTFRRAAA